MTISKSKTVTPWSQHSRQWSQVGSPLRPIDEDREIYWDLVTDDVKNSKTPQAVVLGVTPELALLPWPSGGQITAVDQSQDMIDRVWPADQLPCAGWAICAPWSDMPLDDGSIDVAVGDGSMSVLPSGREYAGVIRELHRVIKPGGQLILRCFVRPDRKEPITHVFAALDRGEIGSMHALKWRIAMALHGTLDAGSSVAEIRDCFLEHIGNRDEAAARLGWPIEAINTIDAYAGSTVTYTFPTMAEIATAFTGQFKATRIVHPAYELGDRCPVIGFKRLS